MRIRIGDLLPDKEAVEVEATAGPAVAPAAAKHD